MKNIAFFILIILGSHQINAQDSLKIERYKMEAGIYIPLDNLADKIGVSSQIGFWYRRPIKYNDILEIGFNMVVPNVRNNFNYKSNDSIYSVKSKGINLFVGCRINKHYYFLTNASDQYLEWISSIGLHFFSFEDKENPGDNSGYYTNEKGEKIYRIDTNTKSLMCVGIEQGFGFNFKQFGLKTLYRFTPYNWFTHKIEKGFGMSALSISVTYGF